MIKKMLSLLLECILALSLCACGSGNSQGQNTDTAQIVANEAEEVSEETTEPKQEANADTDGAKNDAASAESRTESYPEMGLTLNYPADFSNTKGYFMPYSNGEIARGINLMMFYYAAMPEEECKALLEKDNATEEEISAFRDKVGVLLNVIAIDKGRGVQEMIEEVGLKENYLDKVSEIGQAEDVTFYMIDEASGDDEFAQNVEEEYAQEFAALHDSLIEVLKNAEYSVPLAHGSEYMGKKISFETTDVDGNPVKSEEIFAQNKITMLNVWATWCGPCKGELRGLGEMNRSYAGKGVAVVGLCADADTNLEECKKLLAENEVDYLNLLPFEGYEGTIPIPCYPVSYYVDSEGTIIAPPMEGAPADMSTYEEYIDELLEEK